MRHRPLGAVVGGAGVGLLVVVLLATPDATAFVLLAWVLLLAAVGAVALGIALGFRHQASLDATSTARPYLTADWVHGAQAFTIGDHVEPLDPVAAAEDEPVPDADIASAPIVVVRPGRVAR